MSEWTSSDFHDLSAEERGAAYDRAEELYGQDWHDLDPEIRAAEMDRACDNGWWSR